MSPVAPRVDRRAVRSLGVALLAAALALGACATEDGGGQAADTTAVVDTNDTTTSTTEAEATTTTTTAPPTTAADTTTTTTVATTTTSEGTGTGPSCDPAQLRAAAQVVDEDVVEVTAHECAGEWAYASVVVGGDGGGFEAVVLFRADGDAWAVADRARDCDPAVIPPAIYVACEVS